MLDNVGAGIEQYMNLVGARQKVVASNIANADTPGYQTKDIDFNSEFQSQMSGSKPNVMEVAGLKNKNDGNNVDMDREARLLAENALRFSVAENLAHSEITTIRTFAVPGPIISIARAAACERSMIRPSTKGPRSMIRTSTVLLLSRSYTRTQVSNGSVRCAATRVSMS